MLRLCLTGTGQCKRPSLRQLRPNVPNDSRAPTCATVSRAATLGGRIRPRKRDAGELGAETLTIISRALVTYEIVDAMTDIRSCCYTRLDWDQFVDDHRFDHDRKSRRNPRAKSCFRDQLSEKMQVGIR